MTPLEIEKRKPFSANDKHAILLRGSTDGISRCDACDAIVAVLSPDGHWMKQQPYEFDHERARALGGRTHKENGRALCVPCHKIKSADDAEREHKAIRMGGGPGSQYARRQARKAAGERPQIQGRGFQDRRS